MTTHSKKSMGAKVAPKSVPPLAPSHITSQAVNAPTGIDGTGGGPFREDEKRSRLSDIVIDSISVVSRPAVPESTIDTAKGTKNEPETPLSKALQALDDLKAEALDSGDVEKAEAIEAAQTELQKLIGSDVGDAVQECAACGYACTAQSCGACGYIEDEDADELRLDLARQRCAEAVAFVDERDEVYQEGRNTRRWLQKAELALGMAFDALRGARRAKKKPVSKAEPELIDYDEIATQAPKPAVEVIGGQPAPDTSFGGAVVQPTVSTGATSVVDPDQFSAASQFAAAKARGEGGAPYANDALFAADYNKLKDAQYGADYAGPVDPSQLTYDRKVIGPAPLFTNIGDPEAGDVVVPGSGEKDPLQPGKVSGEIRTSLAMPGWGPPAGQEKTKEKEEEQAEKVDKMPERFKPTPKAPGAAQAPEPGGFLSGLKNYFSGARKPYSDLADDAMSMAEIYGDRGEKVKQTVARVGAAPALGASWAWKYGTKPVSDSVPGALNAAEKAGLISTSTANAGKAWSSALTQKPAEWFADAGAALGGGAAELLGGAAEATVGSEKKRLADEEMRAKKRRRNRESIASAIESQIRRHLDVPADIRGHASDWHRGPASALCRLAAGRIEAPARLREDVAYAVSVAGERPELARLSEWIDEIEPAWNAAGVGVK